MKGEDLSREELDAVLNGDQIPVKESTERDDQEIIQKSM